jgi:hypothetical protein
MFAFCASSGLGVACDDGGAFPDAVLVRHEDTRVVRLWPACLLRSVEPAFQKFDIDTLSLRRTRMQNPKEECAIALIIPAHLVVRNIESSTWGYFWTVDVSSNSMSSQTHFHMTSLSPEKDDKAKLLHSALGRMVEMGDLLSGESHSKFHSDDSVGVWSARMPWNARLASMELSHPRNTGAVCHMCAMMWAEVEARCNALILFNAEEAKPAKGAQKRKSSRAPTNSNSNLNSRSGSGSGSGSGRGKMLQSPTVTAAKNLLPLSSQKLANESEDEDGDDESDEEIAEEEDDAIVQEFAAVQLGDGDDDFDVSEVDNDDIDVDDIGTVLETTISGMHDSDESGSDASFDGDSPGSEGDSFDGDGGDYASSDEDAQHMLLPPRTVVKRTRQASVKTSTATNKVAKSAKKPKLF